MAQQRNPRNPEKCLFYIQPTDPLTAEESINRCVVCVTGGNQQLQSLKEDLRQTAPLTIREQTPKYDPDHEKGASFSTFIRSQVCGKLWSERAEHLKSIPFSAYEGREDTQSFVNNPLVDGMVAEACRCEGIDDRAPRCVEIEQFKQQLPQLLGRLSDREQLVMRLKFFEEKKGVEIAKILDVSEARVSQLTHTALAKFSRTYAAKRLKPCSSAIHRRRTPLPTPDESGNYN